MPRILLSAFACDPVTGSEPYVGWNWLTRLRGRYDVTLLTRSYSADLIERHAPEIFADLKILHFDLPGCRAIDHYWKYMKPYYVVWQFAALFYVLYKNLSRRFDVIQHLTYNVMDLPGFLSLVPGPRFIWGPVGGGQTPPESLRQVYGPAWKKQKIRSIAKVVARFNPLVAFSAWRASHVFFANRETARSLSRYCRHWSIMLETAIEAPPLVPHAQGTCLNLLWLGNVIDRKALIIAMDALGVLARKYPGTPVRLVVAGDGPMLPGARERARELSVEDAVEFRGKVPFAEVLGLMEACDAFLFTSVQDTSGNVVLEAMSRGKAIVTIDHQGAAEIVTDESGIKIPVGAYENVVEGFADAIAKLAGAPALTARMGAEAHAVILRAHSWSARMDRYDAVIASFA